MELVLCSCVGHIFRPQPYKLDSAAPRKNNIRLAKVWMDEYAEYFFEITGINSKLVSRLSVLR